MSQQTTIFGDLIYDLKEEYPPIDIIMSGIAGSTIPMCCLTESFGFKAGFNSGKVGLNKEICKNHPVTFIDNPFMEYDHEKHFAMIKRYKPKYATLRDYFTEDQCKKRNIPFYNLDIINGWINDIRPYTKNIIVIPKHRDVIKDIIDIKDIIIGIGLSSTFSKSKLLNINDFKDYDCKIHLLGGDPVRQSIIYDKFRDQVISCDTAVIGMMANKAIIWNPRKITNKNFQLGNIYGSFKFRTGAERRNIIYPINLGMASFIWRNV